MTHTKPTQNPVYRLLKKICNHVNRRSGQDPVKFELTDILCKEPPSNQTAADIFKGNWMSAFPETYNVNAGQINHFDFNVDPRVKWCNDQCPNGLNNKNILELGPFEGYNSWQMEQLGAQSVTAIENNKINYLKCLVLKEITNMNTRFLLGDFISHLATTNQNYDFVWASGVLYHQTEPLKLLDLITDVTDNIFIHTHYYDESLIKNNPDVKDYFHENKNQTVEYADYKAVLHYRSYQKEQYTNAIYSGGPDTYSMWLTKEDIIGFLDQKNFKKITIEIDDRQHPHGPGICFLAQKA